MTDSDATVDPRYAATLQHIQLISDKRASLLARQLEAEQQLLHRIATDYTAGRLHYDDLTDLYMAYKVTAPPGFTHRWDKAVPMRAGSITGGLFQAGRRRANGPAGTWTGGYPFERGSPAPLKGVNVVYVLFDARNVPCYVGSTKNFRDRIKRHAADGKPVAHWQAYPCASRDAAYAAESRLLREHKPYLNKRAS